MSRTFYSFNISDYPGIKDKVLAWSSRFSVNCFLDNHDYTSAYHSYECLVGAGVSKILQPGSDFFASLSDFVSKSCDWIFGHISYNVNSDENTSSKNRDFTLFPDFFFFVPQVVIQLDKNTIAIGVMNGDAGGILEEILKAELPARQTYLTQFESRVEKEEYIDIIQKIKEHIKFGDCYELNYCQEFYAENTFINPVTVYEQLATTSPNPFSCFYKLGDNYVLCASPERYVKKQGSTIISQPIKGTSIRHPKDEQQDYRSRIELQTSEKNKRENVIVVDLVRNDLSKVCIEGTVKVEELYGIYSFPTVYQMISTVIGQLNPEVDFSRIVKKTFPMGSMTGAPKKKVLELIEKYEKTKRGIYSGTIGYITPGKDFDFNVVIRSIVYNDETGYISYHTGGGITYSSVPEEEYEECLIKAAAVFKVFS